jgi:nucleotide-binding universal stress UspA family protein
MQLRHILAAADESDAGRQAVRTAFDLAARVSARVTVLRVLAIEASRRLVSPGSGSTDNGCDETAYSYLRQWLEAGVLAPSEMSRVELAVTSGIPGVEICRFAEDAALDLVVLGRKRHSRMMRLLLGDTADAVARRSRIPCLFVPPASGEVRQILAALDGTARGMNVLTEACDFSRAAGGTLKSMTVERSPIGEPLDIVAELPVARSSSLEVRVQEVLARKNMAPAPLAVRRGEILERVLAEVQETGADVLAVGYHRGGPPGVIEAGSTARRLAHAAPCAVLTIPL